MIQLKSLTQSPWLDRKLLINLGVRYGSVLLLFFVFTSPSCGRVTSMHAQLGACRQDLATARSKISQAVHLHNNRQVLMEKIRLAESKFFNVDELPQLLGLISDLAAQHNLQMKASRPLESKMAVASEKKQSPSPTASAKGGVSPKSSEPPTFYEPHEFEVELMGGYHSMGSFLSALKRRDKLIRIRKLTISPGETLTEHEIRVIVSVFSMKGSSKA